MKLIDSIKKDFTTMTWVLIPVAIAINIAIGELVVRLKLPVYLDSIGTVLVGALAGPWAGALTGALANLIWGIINPYSAPFFYVAAVIGFLAGLVGRWGAFKKASPKWLSAIVGAAFFFSLSLFLLMFLNSTTAEEGYLILPNAVELIPSNWWVVAIALVIGAAVGYYLMQTGGYAGLAGLITGIIAAILSAPTAAYVFGGVTGAGTDLLVGAFRASGAGILSSVLAQGTVSDPFDKMLSFVLVWVIIRALPSRFQNRT